MSAPDRSDGDEVERLLAHVVALPEPDRAAAIASLCAGHPILAAAIRARYAQYQDLLLALATGGESATDVPETGTTFGEFELLRELGRGGMGVVYLARQRRANEGRLVALKLMRDPGLLSERARERLRREAAAAFRLDDPGLCPVLDVGETDGVPWLAMRYVPGRTLAEHIATARACGASELPTPPGGDPSQSATAASSTQARRVAAVLAIGEALARSLHQAHEAGFVHRDVKPGNVMIAPDGRPVLLDFGLVRAEGSDHSLTLTGETLGTPAYMSPEQIDGQGAVDRTTDVYSLGATLWETLTLQRPFDGRTREELFRTILRQDVAALRARGASLPRDVRVVLETAMAREPSRRYASALAFALELGRLRRHEPILSRPPGPLGRLWLWSRRNPLAAGLLVSLFVAMGAVTAVAIELSNSVRLARNAEARAFRHLGSAREAVAELVRLQEEELDDVPGLERLRREIQQRALEFLREVHAGAPDDPALLTQQVDALLLAATLELSLGNPERADRLHGEADLALRKLSGHPKTAALRSRWHLFRGERDRQRADLPAALAAFEQAARELEHGSRDDRDRLQAMQLVRRSGILLRRSNDRAAAMAAVERGLALAGGLTDADSADAAVAVAALLQLRGHLHHGDDRAEAAAEDYRAASARLRARLAAAPDDRHAQASLADCRVLEASLLLGVGDREARAAALDEARELLERLAASFPGMPTYRARLANVWTKWASVHDADGRRADAIAALERAVALCRALVAEQADNTNYRYELATALFNLGNRRGDDAAVAEAMHRESLLLLEGLLARHPHEADWHEGAARAGMNVAVARALAGDARAADHFAAARSHSEEVIRLRPDDWRSRQLRGVLLFNEGVFRAESGDLEDARPLLDAARQQALDNLSRSPRNASRAADLLKWTLRRALVASLVDATASPAAWSDAERDWQTIPAAVQQQLLLRPATAFEHCQLRRGALASAARRGDGPSRAALEQVADDLVGVAERAAGSGAARAELVLCLADLAAAHEAAGNGADATRLRTAVGEGLAGWPPEAGIDETTRRRLAAVEHELARCAGVDATAAAERLRQLLAPRGSGREPATDPGADAGGQRR